jgi:hypothetical protein
MQDREHRNVFTRVFEKKNHRKRLDGGMGVFNIPFTFSLRLDIRNSPSGCDALSGPAGSMTG